MFEEERHKRLFETLDSNSGNDSGSVRRVSIRPLATGLARRSPDIATMAEGGAPGFPLPDAWIRMLGPAGPPEAIVARLNTEINKTIDIPEVRPKLESAGFEIIGSSAE